MFYSVNLLRAIWLAADHQILWNPGFLTRTARAARSYHLPGGKLHAEF